MNESRPHIPASESRTDYRQPAQYQSAQNDVAQATVRFPSSPLDKVYLPQLCHCVEQPVTHHHARPQRVYPSPSPTSNNVISTNRDIIEPPQPGSLEPQTDRPTSGAGFIQQSTADPMAVDIAQTLASLLRLGRPPGANDGGLQAMGPEIAEDARWTETMTHLPLEIGHGYIPENQPVLVPNMTEVMFEGCPDHVTDIDGPPPGSRHYSGWIREDSISNRILIATELFPTDYDTISSVIRCTTPRDPFGSHYADNSTFLLPLVWRQRLYNRLFCPLKFTVANGRIPDLFVEAVLESKVLAIRSIESFLLRVWAEIGVSPFPGLSDFVEDFHLLSRLLKERVKVASIPKYIRFDQITLWTDDNTEFARRWKNRWENKGTWGNKIANAASIRRNYVCGVFDVLFGLWQAPGRCMFHDGWLGGPIVTNTEQPWRTSRWASAGSAVPRCIHNGLYFWENAPPLPDTISYGETTSSLKNEASISLLYLDARFIEFRGPYRFKRAEHLRDHLTVVAHTGKKEILIYTDWKRFLMLRHHEALFEDSEPPSDEISRLQLLSRSQREPKDRRNGRGGDIRYIAYELLHTYQLLFFRGVTERTADGHGYLYHHASRWDIQFGRSSEQIALETLGLHDLLEVKDEITAMFSTPDLRLPESADFNIFRLRLEALNRELMYWRPRTFWHVLWYLGYSEDSKNSLNAGIAAYALFVTIVGLVGGLIQAVYSILSYNG